MLNMLRATSYAAVFPLLLLACGLEHARRALLLFSYPSR